MLVTNVLTAKKIDKYSLFSVYHSTNLIFYKYLHCVVASTRNSKTSVEMLPSRTRPAKSEFPSTTTVYSVVKISSPSCVSSIWVKNAYHVNTCVAALVERSYCSKVIIGLTAISFVNCVWRKGMY